MSKSKIEWTTDTWNPVTGCTRVSAGCDNCYAVTMTKRLSGMPHTKEKYGGLINEGKNHFNGTIKLHEAELETPIKWRKPRMVFVNSMSDLFHKDVPFRFIAKVFHVMGYTPHHTYQILTKRPDRMAEFLSGCGEWEGYITHNGNPPSSYGGNGEIICGYENWPLHNVWLGTSVEDQKAADDRIPHLLKCPAAVRFLSCEPLLGQVNLPYIDFPKAWEIARSVAPEYHHNKCSFNQNNGGILCDCEVLNKVNPLEGIHWVIAGGESGHKARPMHPGWARSLRDQCVEAGVAYFFKQWGEWTPRCQMEDAGFSIQDLDNYREEILYNTGEIMKKDGSNWTDKKESKIVAKAGKKAAGRLLDGKEWNQMPEVNS